MTNRYSTTWTAQDTARLIELRKTHTLQEIATDIGVTRATIAGRLRRLTPPPASTRPATMATRDQEIRALREQGLTRPQIARAVGVSHILVDKILYNKTRQSCRSVARLTIKKPAPIGEGFKERPCLACGILFPSPLQHGKPLYFRCETDRKAA